VKTPFLESQPVFSPDGRFLAYDCHESGRLEVYVLPIPLTGEKGSMVSTNGGWEPLWSPDGKELFYRNGIRWWVVSFETDPEFNPGKPELLFEVPGFVNKEGLSYDVLPGEERFLMVQSEETSTTSSKIEVVVNWFEELKRLCPTDN
jgi:hypothetical protein